MTRSAMVLMSLVCVATTARAQPSVEVSAHLVLPARPAHVSFSADYQPELAGGTRVASQARQQLRLDADDFGDWDVGLTWLATRRFGAQIVLGRRQSPLTGPASAQHVTLQYLARQPPDYVERAYLYDQTLDGGSLRGRLTDWRLAANGVWRPRTGTVTLTLAGGAMVSRAAGWIEPLSFYEFHLGGHSTLFYEEARVRLRLEDSWRVGLTGGLELGVDVGARLSLTAGAQWSTGPGRIPVRVELIDAESMMFPIPETRIASAIHGQSLTITRWGGPLLTLGLRVR